jgi:hypothetical protein
VSCEQAKKMDRIESEARLSDLPMASFGASSAAACGGDEEDRQRVVGDEPVDDDHSDEGDESDKDDFRDWQAEDGEDEEESAVKSLFCAQKLPSLAELVEHDKKHFGFDLQAVVKDVCEDDFSFIKLINFIRSSVKEREAETSSKEDLVASVTSLIESRVFLDGETYLKPVLESDPLLFLFDELFEFE